MPWMSILIWNVDYLFMSWTRYWIHQWSIKTTMSQWNIISACVVSCSWKSLKDYPICDRNSLYSLRSIVLYMHTPTTARYGLKYGQGYSDSNRIYNAISISYAIFSPKNPEKTSQDSLLWRPMWCRWQVQNYVLLSFVLYWRYAHKQLNDSDHAAKPQLGINLDRA